MSKDAIARRKKEILESIADPVVREHYRVQLDEAERFEEEGVVTAFHEVFEDEQAAVAETARVSRFNDKLLLGIVIGVIGALIAFWLLGKF